MNYDVTMDACRVDVDAVWGLLKKTYWSPSIRRDVVARAISNSIVVGAFEVSSGKQVAFARAVTDRATFAWLCDVIVDEEHRGNDLSTRMLDLMFAHPDLQTLRRWCLGTRDAHGIYRRYGFVPVAPEQWMERKLDPSVWSEGRDAALP